MTIISRRSLFHLLSGLSIVIAALFLPRTVLLVVLGVAAAAFLSIDLIRLRVPRLNRRFVQLLMPFLKRNEAHRLTGSSYMLAASLIVLLAFPRDIAVVAICFLAVGDVSAALIGGYIGKMKIFGKTLEGALACYISCVAAGLILYQVGLNISVLAVVIGAAGATIAEVLPLLIDDNFTIPLLSGLAMIITQI
ncbi:diacylglycerol/polyprenol kinase family protein [Chloroflexota bacterium]